MRLTLQVVLAALCMTNALTSFANCDGCSNEFRSCIASAQGMTFAIQACQSREEEAQEHSLNASYNRALKRLPHERQKELREVQHKWLAYRNAVSRFYVGDGLSGNKISSLNHHLKLTAERVRELDEINY